MNYPAISIPLGLVTLVAVGFPALQAGKTPRKPVPSAGRWVDVTSGLAPGKWVRGGVRLVVTVPGKNAFIAGVAGRGLWKTVNGGTTWTELGEAGQITFRPVQVVFDPENPDIFWTAGHFGRGVYKTTNGGVSFEKLSDRPESDSIAVDFSDPERKTLLVTDRMAANHLNISVSGGRTWRSIEENVPGGCQFMPEAAMARDGAILAASKAGLKGIYRSKDLGRTWTRVSSDMPGDPSLSSSQWENHPSFRKDGSIYWPAAGALLVSHDHGKSWVRKPGPVHTPPIEMPNGNLVGAGSGALYVSQNDGDTWQPFGPKLPYDDTRTVSYNDVTKQYMICHGSGSFDPKDSNRGPFGVARWP